MDAQGLEPGGGIGTLHFSIQPVNVQASWRDLLQDPLVVSPFIPRKRPHLLPWGQDTDLDGIGQRGIHKKAAPVVPQE
jgi:hypothetical protein